jgi:carboxymethylenebutenolidase
MAPDSVSGGWNFFLARGDSKVGVVLVHEIFGYSPYTEATAKALAEAGVSAAAIDLFRGKRATSIEEGRALRAAVSREELADGIRNGVELLRREAKAQVVGAMGFCMGGGFALQAACDLGLEFTVVFYGMITDEEDTAKLKGPVLIILGSEDQAVTPWAFQKFLPAAMKHKKRVELELYPNCRHAFHRPGGEAHNPEAAADAWEKTLRFLGQFR